LDHFWFKQPLQKSRPMPSHLEIIDQIQRLIDDGQWRPGTRLPPERDLCATFDVARNTLRKCLEELESRGTLTWDGARTRMIAESPVAEPAADPLLSRMALTSPVEVLEIRMILEPPVAALAAARASGLDLQTIDMALQNSLSASTIAEFELYDGQLHQAIFDAAKNALLSEHCRSLAQIRNQPKWQQLKQKSVTPARRALYDRQHQAIVEALQLRDAIEAERHMREHLRAVRESMLPLL
jgi:GntR family transcriptional regulator, transcriptional repressor for pyruvate dehydrogenase complex